MLFALFLGGVIYCEDANDVNDDGAADITDAIVGVGAVFTRVAMPRG